MVGVTRRSCAICCEDEPFLGSWKPRACCIDNRGGRKQQRRQPQHEQVVVVGVPQQQQQRQTEDRNDNDDSIFEQCNNDIIVCSTCLYNHVNSIILENGSAGGGRTSIQCPLGCGTHMTDLEIRSIIRHHFYQLWPHCIMTFVLKVEETIYQTCVTILFGYFCCMWNTKCYQHLRNKLQEKFYQLRQQYTITQEERQDLRRYELWSVRTAIATRSSNTKEREELICCPAPDCVNMWFASVPYRRYKQLNEDTSLTALTSSSSSTTARSHHHRSRTSNDAPSSPTSRLSSFKKKISSTLMSFADSILYHPPPSENEIDFIEGGEDAKINFLFWVDGYDTFNNKEQKAPSNDGRKLTCSVCSTEFCGLCRRPWMALKIPRHLRHGGGGPTSMLAAIGNARGNTNASSSNTTSSGGVQRTSHEGKSCDAYAQKSITRDDQNEVEEYAFVANSIHARYCPGCSMRTQRIEGCNHMTCLCGMEWCYVCECRWKTWHYGCALRTDEHGNELPNPHAGGGGGGNGCIIS